MYRKIAGNSASYRQFLFHSTNPFEMNRKKGFLDKSCINVNIILFFFIF